MSAQLPPEPPESFPESSTTPDAPSDAFFAVDAVPQGAQVSTELLKAEPILAPLVQETRRGWKTTEFWAAIAAVATDVSTSLPATDKVAILALSAIYAVARGIAKNGVPNLIPPAAPEGDEPGNVRTHSS